jgi:hypothetical protein
MLEQTEQVAQHIADFIIKGYTWLLEKSAIGK